MGALFDGAGSGFLDYCTYSSATVLSLQPAAPAGDVPAEAGGAGAKADAVER